MTIAPDVLSQIDSYARRSGIANRSQVIELWLRRAAQMEAARKLEQDTASYYDSLTADEVAEDAAWAEASSDAFAKRSLD